MYAQNGTEAQKTEWLNQLKRPEVSFSEMKYKPGIKWQMRFCQLADEDTIGKGTIYAKSQRWWWQTEAGQVTGKE